MTLSLRRSIVAIIKPLPASPLKKGEELELQNVKFIAFLPLLAFQRRGGRGRLAERSCTAQFH